MASRKAQLQHRAPRLGAGRAVAERAAAAGAAASARREEPRTARGRVAVAGWEEGKAGRGRGGWWTRRAISQVCRFWVLAF